jgi:hypothetical protein
MKKSQDSLATIRKKVRALLSKMNLEEKVAQLGSVYAAPPARFLGSVMG